MNHPFTMAAEGLERHRFSVSDVERMIEAGVLDAEGRWELIDGEIVPMAAQYMPHARIMIRLATRLVANLDAGKFEVLSGATVELGRHSRVDPDIMVVRAGVSTKIAYAADVLWAIEVSDATRRKDLKIKAPLYAAAAIPDYWVIDLERSVTHIHRNPSASGWGEIVEASFEQEIAPGSFPDLNIVIGSL